MAVTSLARDGVATYAHYNKMSAGFTGTSRIVIWGDTNTRITSTDLVNWTATTGTISSINTTDPYYPITKNGRIICLGGTQLRDWNYSYDGVTFYLSTGVAGDANATVKAFELTAANNITFSSFYNATRNHIQREFAGFSGNIATAPFSQPATGVADNGVNGPGAILVTTHGLNTGFSTNDGITWTNVANGTATVRVNYGIDKFLSWNVSGSGVGTTYYTSTNGSTWTSRTFPVEPAVRTSVRFVGGQWFLGGASGALYTSPDGITWTSRVSGAGANAIYGFGYAAGVYVACGAGGYVATSPDGVTWTARSSGTANALYVVGGI